MDATNYAFIKAINYGILRVLQKKTPLDDYVRAASQIEWVYVNEEGCDENDVVTSDF